MQLLRRRRGRFRGDFRGLGFGILLQAPVKGAAADHHEGDDRGDSFFPDFTGLFSFVRKHCQDGVFADCGFGRRLGLRGRALGGGCRGRPRHLGVHGPRGGGVDRAHNARARGHVVGARLHVEGEFGTALAEFDRVFRQQFGFAMDLLAVHEGSVAAVQIFDRKGQRVLVPDAQHRMFAAHDIVLGVVESDGAAGLAAKRYFRGVGKRERINPVDLGAGDKAKNDLSIRLFGHCSPPTNAADGPAPLMTFSMYSR